jgi:hypothetical protein
LSPLQDVRAALREPLNTVVPRIDNVHVTTVQEDPPRLVELARSRSSRAPRVQEGPLGIKHLDAVVVVVGDEDSAIRRNVYPSWQVELPRERSV